MTSWHDWDATETEKKRKRPGKRKKMERAKIVREPPRPVYHKKGEGGKEGVRCSGLQLFEDVAELTYKRSRRFLSQLIRLSPLGENFARLQRFEPVDGARERADLATQPTACTSGSGTNRVAN